MGRLSSSCGLKIRGMTLLPWRSISWTMLRRALSPPKKVMPVGTAVRRGEVAARNRPASLEMASTRGAKSSESLAKMDPSRCALTRLLRSPLRCCEGRPSDSHRSQNLLPLFDLAFHVLCDPVLLGRSCGPDRPEQHLLVDAFVVTRDRTGICLGGLNHLGLAGGRVSMPVG